MSEGTNQVAGPGQDIRDNQDDFDPVNASASGVIDDLPAWILSLTAVARTGLAFSDSLYERERYEEILKVVARMQEAAGARDRGVDTSVFAEGPRGIPGYVTPKTAVGAIVLDASRRVLLIRRADSGVWLYPTGWADVGYSPAEVVVKEVQEETGVHCTPTHLLAVLDGMRLGFTQVAMYSSIFLCRADGGELTPWADSMGDWYYRPRPFEIRYVLPPTMAKLKQPREPKQMIWLRADGELPDQPLLHACLFAYASDMTLLDSTLLPHQLSWMDRRIFAASLDHAMWFHRNARADDWFLYDMVSPTTQHSRGLAQGKMYDQSGRLLLSVAQEGLIRVRD